LVSIFLVDDSAMARDALRAALEQRPEWVVVGEPYNGRHAVDTFHLHMPHITVMDFIMPQLNGLEASRHLIQRHPDVLILLVTTDPSRQLEIEARRVSRQYPAPRSGLLEVGCGLVKSWGLSI
jgi:DNA-binding NarL/FixJ family response regulator